MNEVLQSFINTIPVIKDAFGMDIMMSITDGNQFLAYWPGLFTNDISWQLKQGYGDIYTSGGGLVAFPGENMIYADILSEIDIRMMDFTVQITAPFVPVE